ncbi:cupin domain-containing protein [Actinomadura madurae]|uniref:cupin domain-containing protein n=1 Tax=Actinomadura madurae TaxID=1993 RepID=UPI000DA0900B|nr:cupin domain-containing protein [Actinomadura madurae]SPT50317.1 Quercetin 2,3-dioxygenase [Actinomadura madurae]
MSYPDALYLGDKGEISGMLRTVDTPPELSIGGRTNVHYLATGASTGGHYGLYRWEMGAEPTGGGAHFHKTFSESFFVLSGTVRLFNGEDWHIGSPGDFLHVPPGGIHAFRNADGPATMLVLFAPGAPREAYFEELADIVGSGRRLTEEEWTDLYRRHDQYMV